MNGAAYVWHGGALQCQLVEMASEKVVPLSSPSVNESYALGSYEGQSMFTLRSRRSGGIA